MKKVARIAGMVILMAGVAQAAEFTWGTAQNISGDADVSLYGISEWAYSVGTTGTFIVNGQTFVGEESFTGNADLTLRYDRIYTEFGGSIAPFTSLTKTYQNVLACAAYASAADGTITLNGLTVGQKYDVQIWINDSRDRGDWSKRDTAIGGTVIKIDHNVTNTHGGLGQYMIATFTADAGTQTVGLISSSCQLNAIQLRAIPEPITLGFIM